MTAANNTCVANSLGKQILRTVEASTMHKVEDDGSLVACWECVAM
jgi:hypothetical protein